MIKINRRYTLIMGIGMIGNPNYTGTSLSGLIKELKPKEKPYSKFQRNNILVKMIERLIGLAIK